ATPESISGCSVIKPADQGWGLVFVMVIEKLAACAAPARRASIRPTLQRVAARVIMRVMAAYGFGGCRSWVRDTLSSVRVGCGRLGSIATGTTLLCCALPAALGSTQPAG